MGTAAKSSIEEYLSYEAPEGYRNELIEGEVILSPEPKPQHEDISRNLVSELETALSGTEFLVRTRTNVLLRGDDSMPSPDVFVIDKARWRRALEEDSYPEGSPQIPIEVYSPTNRPGLLRKKIDLYLKHGAWAVWVVYPKTRTVVVHQAPDLVAEYRMGERIPLAGALAHLSIQVDDVFRLEI